MAELKYTYFNIAINGASEVGKSSILTRMKTGEWPHPQGVYRRSVSLPFLLNDGKNPNGGYLGVILNVCESVGNNTDIDGAIVIFDVTNPATYEQSRKWLDLFKDKPTVLCGNKVDCKNREVKPRDITLHREFACQYYDYSSKSCYNHEKPFLFLMRQLLDNENLIISEITPADLII